MRIPRGDVANAHGLRSYLKSGFSTELPAAAISPGRHTQEVRIVLAGGRQSYAAAELRFEAE